MTSLSRVSVCKSCDARLLVLPVFDLLSSSKKNHPSLIHTKFKNINRLTSDALFSNDREGGGAI